jgi:hypothetical protein
MRCNLCGGKLYYIHAMLKGKKPPFIIVPGKCEIVGGNADCKAHAKTLSLFEEAGE